MKCSRCGAGTVDQIKTWPTVRISRNSKEALILTTGLYECRSCKTRFRAVVERRKMDLKDAMDKIRNMEAQLTLATRERTQLEERVKALDGVDLEIASGEIFALLGPSSRSSG